MTHHNRAACGGVPLSVAARYVSAMSEPRLHVAAPLSAGACLDLDRDQTHYLVSVMRRRVGDGVRLFNGRDGEWRAVVESADRKTARLAVSERLREQVSVPDLHLLFAPVKRARTDFIVEKATELGVRRIRPVITRRTIAERVKGERMIATAREAAEQTERLDLPEILEPQSLDAALGEWEPARRLIFCDEAGEAPPLLDVLLGQLTLDEDVLSPSPLGEGRGGGRVDRGQWAILIGPEGGFDPAERDRLRSLDFVVSASLGPRILRADTAAAAALAIWQAVLGDWCR